jgi:hypothetical protein
MQFFLKVSLCLTFLFAIANSYRLQSYKGNLFASYLTLANGADYDGGQIYFTKGMEETHKYELQWYVPLDGSSGYFSYIDLDEQITYSLSINDQNDLYLVQIKNTEDDLSGGELWKMVNDPKHPGYSRFMSNTFEGLCLSMDNTGRAVLTKVNYGCANQSFRWLEESSA